MERDRVIKKLEKRIHKQRLALRERWEIIRMQQAYRKTPLRSMWFDKAIVLGKDNKALRDDLKRVEKMVAEYSHKLFIEELKVTELQKEVKIFHKLDDEHNGE